MSLCYSSLLMCLPAPGCCSTSLHSPMTHVLMYASSLRYCSTHLHSPVSHVLVYASSLRYCSTHFHHPVALVGCGEVGSGDLAGITQLWHPWKMVESGDPAAYMHKTLSQKWMATSMSGTVYRLLNTTMAGLTSILSSVGRLFFDTQVEEHLDSQTLSFPEPVAR